MTNNLHRYSYCYHPQPNFKKECVIALQFRREKMDNVLRKGPPKIYTFPYFRPSLFGELIVKLWHRFSIYPITLSVASSVSWIVRLPGKQI